MTEFDDIRPYVDGEVEDVLTGLAQNPALILALAKYAYPRLAQWMPGLSHRIIARSMGDGFRKIQSIEGFQNMMSVYFEQMIKASVSRYSAAGLAELDPNKGYLFISNHRDITLDSAFLNYSLLQAGLNSSRIAIGDNLLTTEFMSDLMRLNKSFIIPRSVKGTKNIYASMLKTSRYIRHSIEQGQSIWIAQREGRSKDGLDRTDVALIKMLGLAFRKDTSEFSEVVAQLNMVPVSISYELDPCDLIKAHELYMAASQNQYTKPQGADLDSIVASITGLKGQVHLEVGQVLVDGCGTAENTAQVLDEFIVEGLKAFSTHHYSARYLDGDGTRGLLSESEATTVPAEFTKHLAACPEQEKPFLLAQYANVVRNKREYASIALP